MEILSVWWTVSILALLTACFVTCYAVLVLRRDIVSRTLAFRNALATLQAVPFMEERLEMLEGAHKRLVSRVGMREYREKQTADNPTAAKRAKANAVPDWQTDREGWLTWQQAEINRQRAGGTLHNTSTSQE